MSASKIVLRFVSISFSVLVVVLVITGVYRLGLEAYGFGYRVFTESAMEKSPGKDVIVQVTEETSSQELAQNLENKNLVQSALLFFVQLKLSSYSKAIKPGVYTLNTSMTAREMMRVMSAEEEKTVTDEETQ